MCGVEDQVEFGLRWHFRDVVVSIHDLGDVENLLGEHVTDTFTTHLPLILAVQIEQVDANAPHFPWDALALKRPAILLFLEELKANLTRARGLVTPKLLGEAVDLLLDGAVKRRRRTANVGEVNEVAVDVLRPDGADRV